MFFVLSKVLHWLIYPLPFCFLLCVITLLFYRRRAMRWLLALALLYLYSASAPLTAGWLVEQLEASYQAPVQLQHYDVAIILTGMVRLHIQRPDSVEFNEHVERILAGIRLVQRGVAERLLITGGSGDPWAQDASEARALRPFVLEAGLTEAQILIEDRARNTYENALYSAEIIRQHGFQKLLLVTSAFHMARAAGVFHKQGLFPDLYPVDFHSGGRKQRGWGVWPSAGMLNLSTLMIHELVGMAMYRFQGYL